MVPVNVSLPGATLVNVHRTPPQGLAIELDDVSAEDLIRRATLF
jgi:hypothetical protein